MNNICKVGDLVVVSFEAESVKGGTYKHKALGIVTMNSECLFMMKVIKHLMDSLTTESVVVKTDDITDIEVVAVATESNLSENLTCYETSNNGFSTAFVTDGIIKGFCFGKAELEVIKKNAVLRYNLLKAIDDEDKADPINVFLEEERAKGNEVTYYNLFQDKVLDYDIADEYLMEAKEDHISYEVNGESFAKMYFDKEGFKLYLYPNIEGEPFFIEDVCVDTPDDVALMYNGNPPTGRTSVDEAANKTIIAFYNVLYRQNNEE